MAASKNLKRGALAASAAAVVALWLLDRDMPAPLETAVTISGAVVFVVLALLASGYFVAETRDFLAPYVRPLKRISRMTAIVLWGAFGAVVGGGVAAGTAYFVIPKIHEDEDRAELLNLLTTLVASGDELFSREVSTDEEMTTWTSNVGIWEAASSATLSAAVSAGRALEITRYRFLSVTTNTTGLNGYNTTHTDQLGFIQSRLAVLRQVLADTENDVSFDLRTPKERVSDTIEILTQQVRSGNVYLGKIPESDEEYQRWQEGVDSWARFTLDVVRKRMSQLDYEDLNLTTNDTRRWSGFNDAHRENRSHLFTRIEKLKDLIRAQQSLLRDMENAESN